MDVGLGIARNFSSTRPLFQAVVENVPIAGRALCEADLDLKKRKRAMARKNASKKQDGKENTKTKEMLKEKEQAKKTAVLDQYFAQEETHVAGVKTALLIPLAPTPSARFPLSEHSAEPRFLPMSSLGDLHASHRLHSSRVSSLFTRLDDAKVWTRGASCAAYGDMNGLCTVLRVEFDGWTAEMVRKVIGDAGKEWCQLVESREDDGTESLSGISSLSNFTSPVESTMHTRAHSPAFDPSASFVLPTLDFSSEFLERGTSRGASAVSTSFPPSPALSSSDPSERRSPLSELSMSLDLDDVASTADSDDLLWPSHSDSGSDGDRFSDYSVPNTIGDVSWAEVMSVPRGPLSVESVSAPNGSASILGGMSFSSEFMSRASEPMETAFY
jgi:hypothetical protein